MRYPVVLLDVGDTLISPRESFGAVYAEVWRGLGVERPAADFERGLRAVWDSMSGTIPPGVDRYGYYPGGEEEYWLRFVRRAVAALDGDGADVGEDAIVAALRGLRDAFRDPAAWRVHDDVPQALAGLREGGVRLGVVSNWDSKLPGLLDALGLTPWFDSIGVSHLVGCEKPDPRLFLHVLDEMGATAAEALHVGDIPELDGAGARAAGIDSLIVDRRGRVEPGPEVIPDLSSLPRRALG